MEEGPLSFPDTYVGASARLPLTLANGAPVPATLVCDLTGYPEFELLLSRGPGRGRRCFGDWGRVWLSWGGDSLVVEVLTQWWL